VEPNEKEGEKKELQALHPEKTNKRPLRNEGVKVHPKVAF